MAALLHDNPKLDTARLLEKFRDSPYGSLLGYINRNSRQDAGSEDRSPEKRREFDECMLRLVQEMKNRQIEALKQKGSLNAEEKQLLLKLLSRR